MIVTNRRLRWALVAGSLVSTLVLVASWVHVTRERASSELPPLEQEFYFISDDLLILRQRCIDFAALHEGRFPRSLNDLPLVHQYIDTQTENESIKRKVRSLQEFDYYGEQVTTSLLQLTPKPLVLASTKKRVWRDTYLVLYSDGTVVNMDQHKLDEAVARNRLLLEANAMPTTSSSQPEIDGSLRGQR